MSKTKNNLAQGSKSAPPSTPAPPGRHNPQLNALSMLGGYSDCWLLGRIVQVSLSLSFLFISCLSRKSSNPTAWSRGERRRVCYQHPLLHCHRSINDKKTQRT